MNVTARVGGSPMSERDSRARAFGGFQTYALGLPVASLSVGPCGGHGSFQEGGAKLPNDGPEGCGKATGSFLPLPPIRAALFLGVRSLEARSADPTAKPFRTSFGLFRTTSDYF